MTFKQIIKLLFLLAFNLFLVSCSNDESKPSTSLLAGLSKPEPINRKQQEIRYALSTPEKMPTESYPWETVLHSPFPKITKEYFRCNGSTLNPVKIVQENSKEIVRYYDCGGSSRHSLPLKDNKEYIYPILIDLLNDIQDKTGKRVVITSGHRCPEHNTYVDPSPENRTSKHAIGAEVSFYVQGMEERPEEVVKLIMTYYQQHPKYHGQKAYQEFCRYDASKSNTREQPWYNQEIFIKVHQKTEGRNYDNRHSYPYLALQVRFDWDLQEKVMFSWDKAQKNYMRW